MIRKIFYVVIASIIFSYFSFSPVAAVVFDENFYSTSDIVPFYHPNDAECTTSSGTLGTGAPTALTGASNPEKVWNYFISRGLTPVAAASAMGNMEQESSTFDPWAGERGNKTISKSVLNTGFGIIQWTNTGGNSEGRRYGVMKYLEDNGVRLDASDTSQADQALLLELNWLWDGEYNGMTWQDQVNKETTVGGDPSKSLQDDHIGNGGAMLFHKLVERSGDGIEGKQERIDSAERFLEQFSGLGGSSGGSCGSGVLGGVSSIEDAIPWAEKFISETEAQYPGQKGTPNEETRGADRKLYTWPSRSGASNVCWGAFGCDECTTLSGWFVTNITDYQYGGGDGGEVVGNLASKGVPTGTQPAPFSIFSDTSTSSYGHTGLVLGVLDNGMVITLENNAYGDDSTWIRQRKMPANATYAYVHDRLKVDIQNASTQ